jgi:hypothetical protein
MTRDPRLCDEKTSGVLKTLVHAVEFGSPRQQGAFVPDPQARDIAHMIRRRRQGEQNYSFELLRKKGSHPLRFKSVDTCPLLFTRS